VIEERDDVDQFGAEPGEFGGGDPEFVRWWWPARDSAHHR
jgi:hypothetical protein